MLVVSNDVNNQHAPIVILAAITTTIPKKSYPVNVPLPAGVLPREGTIYCHQVVTIDKADLLRHRGTLDGPKMGEVDRALAVALGLPRLG
jgi:mRNA interferase MazF